MKACEKAIKENAVQLQALEERTTEIKTQLDKEQEEIGRLRTSNANLRSEFQDATATLSKLMKEINEIKGRCSCF